MDINLVVNEYMSKIAPLFEGWQETLIWSCLQGYMGTAYTDCLYNPKSAQIFIGDFCFLAGEANEALVRNKMDCGNSNFMIMVPQNEQWSQDLCSQFHNFEKYEEKGIGVVAIHSGQVVSGASSYTVYHKGIEIEIDTREDYRRRGLALACGAKLILECIKRDLYPSWDAQNKWSAALAEKLGYHFDKEYIAYEVHKCK